MGAAEKRVEDEWLTTTEAAAHCKMSKVDLLRHVNRGDLRPDSRARPGVFRSHRFLRSSLDAWIVNKDAAAYKPVPIAATNETPEVIDAEAAPAGAHLYLVEVVGVCTKIGVTGSPATRIATHRRTASQMGREVGRVWVSPWRADAMEIEASVKGSSRNEYLREPYESAMQRLLSEMGIRDEAADG